MNPFRYTSSKNPLRRFMLVIIAILLNVLVYWFTATEIQAQPYAPQSGSRSHFEGPASDAGNYDFSNDFVLLEKPLSEQYDLAVSDNGGYYILSEKGKKTINFNVHRLEPRSFRAAPQIRELELEDMLDSPPDSGDYFNRSTNIYQAFPPYLYDQVDVTVKAQLYFLYTSDRKFQVSENYFNGRLYKTKIKTDEWTMSFHFDKRGVMDKVSKKVKSGYKNEKPSIDEGEPLTTV